MAINNFLDFMRHAKEKKPSPERYHLIICPHQPDEDIVITDGGALGQMITEGQLWMLLDSFAVSRGGDISIEYNPARESLGTVGSLWVRLNDEICQYERATSRQYSVVLVSEDHREMISASINGVPASTPNSRITPIALLAIALAARREQPETEL